MRVLTIRMPISSLLEERFFAIGMTILLSCWRIIDECCHDEPKSKKSAYAIHIIEPPGQSQLKLFLKGGRSVFTKKDDAPYLEGFRNKKKNLQKLKQIFIFTCNLFTLYWIYRYQIEKFPDISILFSRLSVFHYSVLNSILQRVFFNIISKYYIMVQATSSRKLTMKFFIYLMFCIFSIFPAHSQLSGTKTIDPSGGDYASFTAAINALVTQGVNGPVILNVASGTYTEQVRIREIPGASNVNTITIQSASSDSSSVILTYSSTLANTNWTLRIDSTDYLTIRNITVQATGSSYARVIDIKGDATNINIENCR